MKWGTHLARDSWRKYREWVLPLRQVADIVVEVRVIGVALLTWQWWRHLGDVAIAQKITHGDGSCGFGGWRWPWEMRTADVSFGWFTFSRTWEGWFVPEARLWCLVGVAGGGVDSLGGENCPLRRLLRLSPASDRGGRCVVNWNEKLAIIQFSREIFSRTTIFRLQFAPPPKVCFPTTFLSAHPSLDRNIVP